MNNRFLNRLNSTEVILNSLPRITEAFVSFYGEEERKNIEEKFNNLLVIGFCNPKDINSIINEATREKSDELIENIFNKLNIHPDKRDEFEKAIFNGFSFDYVDVLPLNNCIKYINGNDNDYYKSQMVKILNLFNINATIDTAYEFRDSNQLNTLIDLYKDALKEFNNYFEMFLPYKLYSEKCDILKNSLEKKYLKMYFNELKFLFSEEEIQKIEQEFNKEIFFNFNIQSINGKTKNLFVNNLQHNSLIEAFSKENEEKLNSKGLLAENVKYDRISYFNNLGFKLGDDYNAYLNNEDVKKIIPSSLLVDKIIKTREELNILMKNEYYQSLEEYKHNINRIENAKLLDKNHGYDANSYELDRTCICTNLKGTDNGIIMNPILYISMGSLTEYLDHGLIHELNHVYELNLKSVDENKYSAVCGWDLVDGNFTDETNKISNLKKRTEKRNYELFNEIINELISQEITELLFESNGYIFNNKKDAKIKYGTSYEDTLFLVKDFYDNYKTEIIESRKLGDISKLFDTVGKENFESLNNLFHLFYKIFPGYSFYDAYDDYSNGIDSERAKQVNYIFEQKRNIMMAMYEHSDKKVASL